MTATHHASACSSVAPPVASDSQFCRDEGAVLFKALWRSADQAHYMAALDRNGARFHNEPVRSVGEAISRMLAWADADADAYFACAEYIAPSSRTAANASGAWGFWLDVDCGDRKAANGSGYRTIEDAWSALERFCAVAGLPSPTHIVESGGGLHLYWVLNQSVGREQWQQFARKFKQLNEVCGFRSDGSRTADIASLLRVPGSLNFKYKPPRPVRLTQASANFIGTAVMLDAIDRAYNGLCETSVPAPGHSESVTRIPPTGAADRPIRCPIDLLRLASALAVLDPDCEDETWKLRRLAPLADAAQAHPELADALCDLAREWSSGSLRGNPSHKWQHPGGNGLTGEQIFAEVWTRFLKSEYGGRRTTLGTIFYDAAEVGWSGADIGDQFQMVDGDEEA